MVWVAIKIRNVGRGPALLGRNLTDVFLRTRSGGNVYGWTPSLVVAPEDEVFIAIADGRTPSRTAGCLGAMLVFANSGQTYEGNSVTVVVRYTDVGGTRWTESHMKFLLKPDGMMEQRGIEIEGLLPGGEG